MGGFLILEGTDYTQGALLGALGERVTARPPQLGCSRSVRHAAPLARGTWSLISEFLLAPSDESPMFPGSSPLQTPSCCLWSCCPPGWGLGTCPLVLSSAFRGHMPRQAPSLWSQDQLTLRPPWDHLALPHSSATPSLVTPPERAPCPVPGN